MPLRRDSLKRALVVAAMLSTASLPAFSQKPLDLGARFSLATDNGMLHEDYFDIVADLELEFEASKRFICTLDLEADRFEVEVEELSFEWKAHPYLNLLFGQFENALSLEEYIPAQKRRFAVKSLISEQVDTQGYEGTTAGLKAYREYDKADAPLSYLLHASLNVAHTELQVNAGFLCHFAGKDSWLGVLAAYLPYFVHESNLAEWSSQTHNVLVDLIWANYERKLFYGSEVVCGSNLLDPIGFVGHPQEADRPYFLGLDAHLGCTVGLGSVEWLPALRLSLLFPDLGAMEANQLEVRVGNLMRFPKDIFLHFDGGIAILTRYREAVLYTKLEALWALQFMVRI